MHTSSDFYSPLLLLGLDSEHFGRNIVVNRFDCFL
jgi:hypothetical protein